jgi:hypothetical protein
VTLRNLIEALEALAGRHGDELPVMSWGPKNEFGPVQGAQLVEASDGRGNDSYVFIRTHPFAGSRPETDMT